MSSENDTYDYTNNSLTDYDATISKTVKFWVFLIFLIPSIICSLFILIYTIINRTICNTIHYHVIIIIVLIGMIYQITIYPWMLYYYHYEGIWERSPLFCMIWSFIDWGLYYIQTILFAWASIERHIFIFHSKWISTKKKRFLVHYLPLIILLTYCFIFYIIVDFFLSCQNLFDNSYMICVTFCFTNNYILYMWDLIVHQILPNFIIVVFSISLFIRVLWQKHRIHQTIQHRKHWKMTVQLLSISIIYLLFAFPLTLMNLMYLCDLLNDLADIVWEYLLFFNYFMLLLLPFPCILSLPELRKKLKIFRLQRHNRTISPIT